VTAAVSCTAVTALVFVTVKPTIPMPPGRNLPTGLILVVSWAWRDAAEPAPEPATAVAGAVAGAVAAGAGPAEAGLTGAPGPVAAGGGRPEAGVEGAEPEAGVDGAAEDGSEREEPGAGG